MEPEPEEMDLWEMEHGDELEALAVLEAHDPGMFFPPLYYGVGGDVSQSSGLFSIRTFSVSSALVNAGE